MKRNRWAKGKIIFEEVERLLKEAKDKKHFQNLVKQSEILNSAGLDYSAVYKKLKREEKKATEMGQLWQKIQQDLNKRETSKIVSPEIGDAEDEEEQKKERELYAHFLKVYKLRQVIDIPDLANKFEFSEKEIVRRANILMSAGLVYFKHDRWGKKLVSINIVNEPDLPIEIYRSKLRILSLTDSRLGANYGRPDLLTYALMTGEKLGIDFAVIAGNTFAGNPLRGREEEYFLFSSFDQICYGLKLFSEIMNKINFNIYFVAGQRDLSFRQNGNLVFRLCQMWRQLKTLDLENLDQIELGIMDELKIFLDVLGIEVIQKIKNSKKDLIYRGGLRTVFRARESSVTIDVLHPSDEDAPYAKSYHLQGIVEAFLSELVQQAADNKEEKIALMGCWGVPMLDPQYKVLGVALPPLRDLPPSVILKKRKGLTHETGFHILELDFDEENKLKEPPKVIFRHTNHHRTKDAHLENPLVGKFPKEIKKHHIQILKKLMQADCSAGILRRELNLNEIKLQKSIDEINKYFFKRCEIIFDEIRNQYNLARNLVFDYTDVCQNYFQIDQVIDILKNVGMSDNHIGSLYQQPHIEAAIYDLARKKRVKYIFHAGDGFDGRGVFGQKQEHEVFDHTFDGQLLHAEMYWPKVSGIKTFIIAGNHCQSFNTGNRGVGADIVKAFARKRKDLVYLGKREGKLKINNFRVQFYHPSGGVAYGKTYRIQRFIESLTKDLADRSLTSRPDQVIYGHWHTAFYIRYKGIDAFSDPSVQSNTSYIHIEKGWTCDVGAFYVKSEKNRQGDVFSTEIQYYNFAHLIKTPYYPPQEFYQKLREEPGEIEYIEQPLKNKAKKQK